MNPLFPALILPILFAKSGAAGYGVRRFGNIWKYKGE